MKTITGTVVYLDLEGGFWGIEGDDGQKYRPVEPLPDAVRTQGCRVEAAVEAADAFSFAMWGRSVHLRDVHSL